jgi:choline dehydrogenase-like flavoprotein
MTTPTPQYTDFSKDVLGRYVCNGLDEAIASTSGPGGRPFDLIIVGGGSFGATLAQHLLALDTSGVHRILVLEAGPYVLPEHVQNLPVLGLSAPGPTTVDPGVPRAEVWGLPWRTNVADGFPGLAYCTGGRSLFWGGWSPQLLVEETPANLWPAAVLADLRGSGGFRGYFAEAAEQIGVTQTNDFVFGKMHRALRKQLFDGLQAGAVPAAIPLATLPLAPLQRDPNVPPDEQKLEAPLAVQGRPPRPGFFPFNKFSGMPLLIRAARQAQAETGGDDHRKRLMVIPNCHVTQLETTIEQGIGQVRVVHTSLGPIPVPDRGVIVLASGTIESTRLALESFPGIHSYGQIGTNLLAHLRSNLTFRVPRAALAHLPAAATDLQASALFVKGRVAHADGSHSTFHLQITAAGLVGLTGANSEAELFQKIPDIDTLDRFAAIADDHVVITVRGIGEMQPLNPDSKITLTAERDEFNMRRAFVQLGNPADPATAGESAQTANDRNLWAAMDTAAAQVRSVLTNSGPFDDLGQVRDGLGTTHHEAGTLRMGIDPAASVTTPNGRFHHVVNAYAIGPALLPSTGSPNPMLSGVALARRLAAHLVAPLPPPPLENGYQWLFDGTAASLAGWQQIGPGAFDLIARENVLTARPGNDIGVLTYVQEAFGNFNLRLQLRIDGQGDNSGLCLRFRDPRLPAPDLGDPLTVVNPAWIAIDTGFELQIDELARPDQADQHRTGAIYDIPLGAAVGEQQYQRGSTLQPGEWNDLEIEVNADTYTAMLNGYKTVTFTNKDATRGRPAGGNPASGYLGLQEHTGAVSFRAIRVKKLP